MKKGLTLFLLSLTFAGMLKLVLQQNTKKHLRMEQFISNHSKNSKRACIH